MGLQIIAAALAALFAGPAPSQAAPVSAAPVLAPAPPICRRVSEQVFLRIDAEAAARLAEIGLDRAAIFERIRDEHELTRRWVAAITGSDALLADNPALARSIRNRFPYLVPLHHLQVAMLRRRRAGDEDELVAREIQLTLNGLATGLRNSG